MSVLFHFFNSSIRITEDVNHNTNILHRLIFVDKMNDYLTKVTVFAL